MKWTVLVMFVVGIAAIVISSSPESVNAVGDPNYCGDDDTYYLVGDLNQDCYVGLEDLAIFAHAWLDCTDPGDPTCN